jgi:hypothetical protein
MISSSDSIPAEMRSEPFASFADRWMYVFMAGLFVAAALTGFIPDSFELLAAVESGQRPPLPLILHAHALVMGSWLLLFLAQTTLVATGRTAQHRKLGLVGAVLAVAVVVVAIGLVKSRWSGFESLSPAVLSRIKPAASGILLEQIRELVLFPIFVTWALLVRKTDSETHRRLMLFATLLPLPAAIDRITWIPTTLPDSPMSVHIGMLSLLLPVLVYDVLRRGRVHRAYVIGLALNVPFLVASHLLRGSPWWVAAAPKLMGSDAW